MMMERSSRHAQIASGLLPLQQSWPKASGALPMERPVLASQWLMLRTSMHVVVEVTPGLTKAERYRELNAELAALLAGEPDGLANTANTAALLYARLPELNWAGFYFLRGQELVLGPFQGKVACVRIALGRGVCGAAAQKLGPLIVPNVNAFPGHIACDAASRSEIVVPLVERGRLLGVLDLDSPELARFDQVDADGLGVTVELLLRHSDLSRLVDRAGD
jgi:L-methionine (R)-S-oxide reductase